MLTNEQLAKLRDLKNNVNDDNIRIKNAVKKILIGNPFIIHVLNNNSLDEDCPQDYIGENIFDFYFLPGVQTEVKNFICFDVGFEDISRTNKAFKLFRLEVYILSNFDDTEDKETGISRPDLLGYLISCDINHKDIKGLRFTLISDKPTIMDNTYSCRCLIFEATADNGIAFGGKVVNRV